MNIRYIASALALSLALSSAAFAAEGSMNMDMDHTTHGQPAATGTMDHSAMGADHNMAESGKQVFTGTGSVVSVDKAAKKIVLAHDPITALGWPAMTMGFAVEDAALLDGIASGQKVRFDFRTQGNVAVIVDIEPGK